MPLRVCIAGVGAVGGTVAARLAGAGEHVSLLARGARLGQLERDGLRVEFDASRAALRLPCSDRPEFGVQDVVFLATKAQGLVGLLPTLAPLIGPETLIVPLVNGVPWWYFQGSGGRFDGDRVTAVDPRGTLRDGLARQHLIGCIVYCTARLLPDGIVSTMGAQRMVVGELDNQSSARAQSLVDALTRSGIAAQASTRIRDDLWTKIALNLATNPLSVLTEATLAEQFTDPRLLSAVNAVLEEARRVAAALGATPTMSLEQMLATGRKAGPFETSMLQDYRAGRPLELDAIGHSVLELAAKVGHTMPATQLMLDLCAHRAARRSDAPSDAQSGAHRQ